jgi:transposase
MLIQAVEADAGCRLLMSIPNIGPINAAALSVALEAPGVFACGRAFAAYFAVGAAPAGPRREQRAAWHRPDARL